MSSPGSVSPVEAVGPVGVLDAVVARLLDGARRPAVVVTDLDVTVTAAETTVRRVGEPLPEGQQRTVLLVSADAAALRTDVSRVGELRWARMVGCVVLDHDAAPVLRPHPSWPALVDLDARLESTVASVRLDFAARLEVAPVLLALARDVAAPVPTGPGGLRVAGAVVPPADPTYAASYDVADERPADVVVAGPDDPGEATEGLPTSPVLGRAPLRLGPEQAGEPLDEAVFSPIGFRRTWTRPMVDVPVGTTLTPALVRGLRDAQGVRLPAGADPRLVAGLAMSGVPIEQVDDAAERERRSVRTRRAALLEHATPAWRARLADLAGVRLEEHPEDVVCSTDVPEEVTDLLLARRYSGADLVVLPDPGHDEVTEAYVATPPPGAVLHARGRTPEQVVAAGGVVYVGRPRSVR